jgi:diguanylate cyclase (GGDEF)-like protein
VDDDAGAIRVMARILEDVDTLRFASNGTDALQLARASPPDLILLDAEMPGMSGLDLLKALKSEPSLADVPVIFVTSHGEAAVEVSALQLGAADFIIKPFQAEAVLARVRTQLRWKHSADSLRRAAATDGLTGIANRRAFDGLLEREWMRTRRTGESISLLLVDVDHFKRYNDRYGHPGGDLCLQRIALALHDACQRPADQVARYGGEEFVVLLPDTPRRGALCVADRILTSVATLAIAHDDSPTARHVTVSIGIACQELAGVPVEVTRAQAARAAEMVRAADEALYRAKGAGRAQAGLSMLADC